MTIFFFYAMINSSIRTVRTRKEKIMKSQKLTTNLSDSYKLALLEIAITEKLSKIEYKTSIEYLIDDWRYRHGKDKLDNDTKQ